MRNIQLGKTKLVLLTLVGRRVDNAIHWINLYLVDRAVRFVNTYPLDSIICSLKNWTQVYM